MQTTVANQVVAPNDEVHQLESQIAHLQTMVAQENANLSGINASLQVVAKNSAPTLSHSFAEYGLLIATIALAAYTARLFRSTRDLAKDTLQASKYSDRHHQESLTPCVVIDGIQAILSRSSPNETLGIYGALRNVGTGPALNIKVILHVDDLDLLESVIEAGSLKPGGDFENRLKFDVRTGEKHPYSAGVALPFLVRINYLNIFGQLASTLYIGTSDESGRILLKTAFAAPSVLPRELDAPNLFNNAVPDV